MIRPVGSNRPSRIPAIPRISHVVNETAAHQPAHRRTLGWVLLEFLGSMNLAITLLVVVAVASVIGTVLQQNQPYPIMCSSSGRSGSRRSGGWGLYDVYGAGWFIGILAFLILSTSVCLYRQVPALCCGRCCDSAPGSRLDSLRGFHQHRRMAAAGSRCLDASGVGGRDRAHFSARGYRWRIQITAIIGWWRR
jgi:cytochrome c biogenesis protein